MGANFSSDHKNEAVSLQDLDEDKKIAKIFIKDVWARSIKTRIEDENTVYIFDKGYEYIGDIDNNGFATGPGKIVFKKGTHGNNAGTLEANFENGKIVGSIKFLTLNGDTYEGYVTSSLLRHGHGKLTYSNGDIFEGEFKNGKKYGHGKYMYKNGDVYEGEYKDGEKHGHGKCVYKNGDVYEGEYKDGKKYGHGKCVYKNGDVYEGEYKDDKKHGYGKYVCKNGDVYKGEFKNDKLQGHGKYMYKNGDVYEGGWKNNYMDGHGKLTYKDNICETGVWHMDKKNGVYLLEIDGCKFWQTVDNGIVKSVYPFTHGSHDCKQLDTN
jgi:hypothetical protein